MLAIVATFIHTDAGVESVFHQMALQGLTSAAYSEGSFRQFGAGLTREVSISVKASPEEQETHVLAAADALGSGEFNCTVAHLFYTDHTAHEEGVGTPVYKKMFRRADALIPLIRAKLPAGATLVITGDHGHDLKGRHGIALDVPTLAIYAGPRFRRGVDLGVTPVMTHRYLLSHALGLPVTTDAYKGDLLPAALISPPVSSEAAGDASVLHSGGWLTWLYLSFIAALWFNLVCRSVSPMNFSGGRAFALWAGITPFLLKGYGQVAAGLIVAAALLWLLAWNLPWRSILRWLVLPIVAALAFQGWGHVLIEQAVAAGTARECAGRLLGGCCRGGRTARHAHPTSGGHGGGIRGAGISFSPGVLPLRLSRHARATDGLLVCFLCRLADP